MASPSETTALLPKTSLLRQQLLQNASDDGKLQKSEFKVLLLRLGIRIRQAVLDDIFTACDTDGDGGLTVDEILQYITTTKPRTIRDGVSYTVHKVTSSIVWWFAVAFHFAAWVGVTSFIYTEQGRHIRAEWGIVGAWFFFFGAVYFFKLLLDAETTKYDTFVQAEVILKNCVDKDPTFFDRKAGDDASMDLVELNAVLEEQGLYLPRGILMHIFETVDIDKSGMITKDEIMSFSQTLQATTNPTEREKAILDAVIHTWGFWSLICWFIGSILFLVGVHLSYAGFTEPPLPSGTYLHLYGMGSFMYFLLAVCMIPMLESDAKGYLESVEQMDKAFAHRRERSNVTTNAELFRTLDGEEGDGNLHPLDLYEVLIEDGVLIPFDTFLELFKVADVSGDGRLQAGEFANFIANMQVAKTPWQYCWLLLKRVPFTPSFFGWFMFFIGGIFYTLGSYLDRSDSVGWYFAGAVSYGLASGKSVFGTIRDHWLHFQAVEAGTSQFKARVAGDGLPNIA